MNKKFIRTGKNYRNSQVIGLDRYQFRQVSLYNDMYEQDNAKHSIPAHPTFVNDLDLWSMSLKINRFHPLLKDNICVTFDKDTLKGYLSINFIRWIQYLTIMTFDLWSYKLIHVIHSSQTTFCAKLDQITLKGLMSIVITRLFLLWAWPLTSDLQNQ